MTSFPLKAETTMYMACTCTYHRAAPRVNGLDVDLTTEYLYLYIRPSTSIGTYIHTTIRTYGRMRPRPTGQQQEKVAVGNGPLQEDR